MTSGKNGASEKFGGIRTFGISMLSTKNVTFEQVGRTFRNEIGAHFLRKLGNIFGEVGTHVRRKSELMSGGNWNTLPEELGAHVQRKSEHIFRGDRKRFLEDSRGLF